jgi:uncharacterized protein (TIGR03435 family)
MPLTQLAANHLWQSTASAAVAALLALALRANHARARYGLWLAASVKFLVPFSAMAAIGGSLGRWFVPAAPISRVPLFAEQIVQPFAPSEFASLPVTAAVPAPSVMPALLLSLWLCGVVAVLFYAWTRWRHVAAAVHSGTHLTEGRELEALCKLQKKAGQEARPTGVRRWFGWGGPPGLPSVVSSTAKLEPGVFGIFRPVLWLPAGIADRLEDAELEAILAHELCHIRRRDNLLSAIHMLVEALFWFHPLVWWLGARLEEERERACDEDLVRIGGEPQIYAESILKVVEFYLASPVACAAGVSGGDLKKRIEGIMANRFPRDLGFGKKVVLAAVAVVAISFPFTLGVIHAGPQTEAGGALPRLAAGQSSASQPAFEVASVKHTDPHFIGSVWREEIGAPVRGRFTAENTTLVALAMHAYGAKDGYQIDSKSDWMGTEPYDVVANVPAGATKEQFGIMLQRLLTERFGLAVHRETRQVPGYRLVVAEGGAKLKKSVAALAAKAGEAAPESSPQPPAVTVKNGTPQFSDSAQSGELFTLAGAVLRGRHENMQGLAGWLAGRLQAPVIDATGLEGEYDYDLSYTTEPAALSKNSRVFLPPGAGAAPPEQVAPAPPDGHPTIWTAIKSQLGLKLEAVKAPVEVLVLDRANRDPTEN